MQSASALSRTVRVEIDMYLEEQFSRVEARALSCLRNIDPVHGTISDYRKIIKRVDIAARALEAANKAIYTALDHLADIADSQ